MINGLRAGRCFLIFRPRLVQISDGPQTLLIFLIRRRGVARRRRDGLLHRGDQAAQLVLEATRDFRLLIKQVALLARVGVQTIQLMLAVRGLDELIGLGVIGAQRAIPRRRIELRF